MNEPLANMLRYDKWATLTLLERCRLLSPEQLDFEGAGTSGTIGELLTHVVGGQQTFLLRTKGRQHEGELNRWSPWPGIDALVAIVHTTSDELIAIAGELTSDEKVVLPWQGTRPVFPKSFFLVHAMEHGVEHRTEIKIGLAQIRIETPDLDGWEWSEAAGYGQEG